MIVQRGGLEILGGRQLFDLVPPLREESGAFLPDERCQFIEVIDDLLCGSLLGLSRHLRRASQARQGQPRHFLAQDESLEDTANLPDPDVIAASLADVVNHYDRVRGLRLAARQKSDLVDYFKTL